MEKKLSFNENADNYDRLRPRYCSELFADIAAYAGLKKGAAALEVGPWHWAGHSAFSGSGMPGDGGGAW